MYGTEWGGWSRCGRSILLAVVTTAVVVAVACLPACALAAEPPGDLADTVTVIAQEESDGSLSWARYVTTSAEAAAPLLGKSRDQLFEGTPDQVYLVVLRGSFSMQDAGLGSGPYLAFLYWHGGETWQATDFAVLQEPVSLRSLGRPQDVESFALAHPLLDRLWVGTRLVLLWFAPPLVLVLSAFLCAWKRRSGWPYVLAACVTLAVAGWQSFITVRSFSGQSWDPAFHGAKIGLLAVVVIVDLAAAAVLLRARTRRQTAARITGRSWLGGGILLLAVAAAFYLGFLPWLVTTGA